MATERITDKDWELKVKPNLASLPAEELIALSRSLSLKDFQKATDILSKFLKPKIKEGIQQQDK